MAAKKCLKLIKHNLENLAVVTQATTNRYLTTMFRTNYFISCYHGVKNKASLTLKRAAAINPWIVDTSVNGKGYHRR